MDERILEMKYIGAVSLLARSYRYVTNYDTQMAIRVALDDFRATPTGKRFQVTAVMKSDGSGEPQSFYVTPREK